MSTNPTILYKLRIIFFISIAFLTLHIGINYLFTKSTIHTLNHIKTDTFQIASIHADNLHLFEKMMQIFQDAARTREVEQLFKAEVEKNKILNNLEQLQEYNNDTMLKQEKNIVEQLYSTAKEMTKEVITKKHLKKKNIDNFQEVSSTTHTLFIHQRENAFSALYVALDTLSHNNSNFFSFSLLLSTFGFLIIVGMSLHLYLHIEKRFVKVRLSL